MNTTTTISNYEDVIDSREVIARIEELEGERDEWVASDPDVLDTGDKIEADEIIWATEYPEDAAELEALQSLAEEAEGYAADWQYGEALIRYSYFTEYVMEMLRDRGELPSETPWYIAIDEDATAENIKIDYTEVDFNGVSYYIR